MRRPRSSRTVLTAIVLTLALAGCDSAADNEGPFYVAFTKRVEVNETGSQLACSGTPEYSLGHPTYVATFASVDGATSYRGRVLKKDGSYAAEMALTRISDEGNSMSEYTIGVGSIFIFTTCSQSAATAEQQRRLDAMDDIGHQGVEITPIF